MAPLHLTDPARYPPGAAPSVVIVDPADVSEVDAVKRWTDSLPSAPSSMLVLPRKPAGAATWRAFLPAATLMRRPFSLDELEAKARAALRRAGHHYPAVHHVGAIEINDDTATVHVAHRLVSLSPTEFRLLRFLARHSGRPIPKEEIIANVWPYDHVGSPAIVDNYVNYLRRKLGDATLIRTERGRGVRLDAATDTVRGDGEPPGSVTVP